MHEGEVDFNIQELVKKLPALAGGITIPQKSRYDAKAELEKETDVINSILEGKQWNF
jgi:hypothetical protein